MAGLSGLAPGVSQSKERQHVGERAGFDGNLDDFGARRVHRGGALRQIRRDGAEIMRRQHDAAAAPEAHDVGGEPRCCLHVDELGSGIDGRLEDLPPFALAASELSAFPRGAAGGDDRPTPAFDGGNGIRPVQVIEAQLDEIGPLGRIPFAAQLFDRPSRNRDAYLWIAHG